MREHFDRATSRPETLLVVDDDPAIHPLIDLHLDGVVARFLHAESGADGLRIAQDYEPDVILLDLHMPHMDGFRVCRQLKSSEHTRDIPVLFLTGDEQDDQIVKALDGGGVDYVIKPFTAAVLRARVRATLRNKRLIDLLKDQAHIDAVTGLGNRAAFAEAIEAQRSEYSRTGAAFGLAILDLDFFKEVNDGYGHGVGDEVLRRVGDVIRDHCRRHDGAFRFGGDEFAILLRHTGPAGAEAATLRVLDEIHRVRVAVGDQEAMVTCSAGLACANEGGGEIEMQSLLDAADAALYGAKNAGRDRLLVLQVPAVEGREKAEQGS